MQYFYFLVFIILLSFSTLSLAANPKPVLIPDATEYVYKGVWQILHDLASETTFTVTKADIQEAQPVINQLEFCNGLPVKKGLECLRKLEIKVYELSPKAQQLVKWKALPPNIGLCYDKSRGPLATQITKMVFLIDVKSGDLQQAAQNFANIAMCYWSHNNFAKAKQYIDKFEYLFPLASHSYHGIVQDSISNAGPNLIFKKGQLWFFGHRFVRFMENTRRTKHRYLCRNGKKICLNAAWEMMQEVKSASFREAHIAVLLENSVPKVSQLYEQRSKFKVEHAFLELLTTDMGMSNKTRNRIKELKKQIQLLDFSLHDLFPKLKRFETPSIVTLKTFRKKLKTNETFISFILSMTCRTPLVWRVERNRTTQFKRVGKRGECSTRILTERIADLRHKIQSGMTLKQLDSDLKWFRQQLFEPVGLPPIGSKLILSVDERLVGLPFELIPTKYGRLGEIYQVTYVPSASMLYEWRASPTPVDKTTIPYIGFVETNIAILVLMR